MSCRVARSMDVWMSRLPEEVRRRPLYRLAIPGSHNAFSYALANRAAVSGISPDVPHQIKRPLRWAPRLVQPLVMRWCVCQQLDVSCQLAAGVRYLDIRLEAHHNQLHVVHALRGPTLERFLVDVAAFLALRPGELVLLDFQHVYGVDEASFRRLSRLLEDVFRSRLVSVKSGGSAPVPSSSSSSSSSGSSSSVSSSSSGSSAASKPVKDGGKSERDVSALNLADCTAAGQQVMCIFRGKHKFEQSQHPHIWDGAKTLRSRWANTQDAVTLRRFLDVHMKRAASERRLHVHQCIFTPQPGYLALNFGRSLRQMSQRCAATVLEGWLAAQSVDRGLNVVMLDFIDKSVTQKIVMKNYEKLTPTFTK